MSVDDTCLARTPRRAFLERAGKAALGLTLYPADALRHRQRYPVAKLTKTLIAQTPGWMKAASVPGLSIAVIQNARIVWRHAFGVKDAATGLPVTAETVFEAASLSKPVFAYLVMKLAEDGVLNLDTPLTRYAPERFLDGDDRLDLITARHVLSHTAGFQNWRSDKSPLAIHFTPGSKYQYSGEGYHYLQTVITRLLGEPFERYVRARLLAPLGMTSSSYVWDDNSGRRMATPHDGNGKPLENNKSTSESVARYGSAGSLRTTPSDYATFVTNVIDPPPADRFRLTRESVTEMLRPHVKLEGGPFPASWALGWQVFHNPARDFIFHGGNNKGFHSAAVASAAGKSGYVAMTNGDNGPQVLTTLLTADVMQEFLGS
jgi:CubicO group peptidase (beta-lactamase class C family)